MDIEHHDSNPLKKNNMGVVGAVIVISQAITQTFSSIHSSRNMSYEIQELRADQDKYFVKKQEMKKFSEQISNLRKEIAKLNSRIKIIRDFSLKVESDDDDDSVIENHDKFSKFKKPVAPSEEVVGCTYTVPLDEKVHQQWRL